MWAGMSSGSRPEFVSMEPTPLAPIHRRQQSESQHPAAHNGSKKVQVHAIEILRLCSHCDIQGHPSNTQSWLVPARTLLDQPIAASFHSAAHCSGIGTTMLRLAPTGTHNSLFLNLQPTACFVFKQT